jgi:hypothetical protein
MNLEHWPTVLATSLVLLAAIRPARVTWALLRGRRLTPRVEVARAPLIGLEGEMAQATS